MLFRRMKTPGLAHNSYVLECGSGQAVVVDPRRDVDGYLRLARQNGLTISHVLVTHRQEDFELGSAALARATGARVVAGSGDLFGARDIALRDGEAFNVAGTRFVALHTPSHTPESMSYAAYVKTAGERCWGVFTGDALFVGETGRTDLENAAKAGENAAALYDAIHAKIAPLGDQALVFPAHGAGSACGGNISDRDDTSLGIERATNPVFVLDRDGFIVHKEAEKLPRPPYFSHMEDVNLEGGRSMPSQSDIRLLQPREFGEAMKRGVVIDTRSPDAFSAAHIAGSYNVWLHGLSTFGGWIADHETAIFLVTESPDFIETAATALARVGIDNIEGALAGGIAAWREGGLPFSNVETVSAMQAWDWIRQGQAHVLDVRDELEWNEKHIPRAMHVYVGELERHLPREAKNDRLVVHCSVGNRSGLATSVLKRNGFTNVYNMLGGMKAWQKLDLPVE